MIQLTLTDTSGRERIIPIGSDPKVLGRGEDSDVVLGSRSVARHQIKVWEAEGKVWIQDVSEGEAPQALKLEGQPVQGTIELVPTALLQVGIFTLRITGMPTSPAAPAVVESARSIPLLIGLKGNVLGAEIELQQGESTIGRDTEAYLSIDDPSISKQHASLFLEGDVIRLEDRQSTNGTFVNGRRTSAATIKNGDRLRFGDLEFLLRIGAGTLVASDPRRMARLVLVAGVSLVIACLSVYLLLRGGQPPPPATRGSNSPLVGEELTRQIEIYMQAARDAWERGNWGEVTSQLDALLELEPIHPDARRMRNALKTELANKLLFDSGNTSYDLNKWVDALQSYQKIPKDSFYFRKVRYRISEITERLALQFLAEAKVHLRGYRWRSAHEQLTAYLALRPCDSHVVDKYLKPTEARLQAYRIAFQPVLPTCESEGASVPEAISVNPVDTLKKLFPEKALFEVVQQYLRGKGEVAVALLRQAKSSPNRQLAGRAKQIELQIMIVMGKSKEGSTRLLGGDWMGARESFHAALEAEKKILSGDTVGGADARELRSYYREEIGRQLSEILAKRGQEEYSRDQWRQAFGLWNECVRFRPDDTRCLAGLGELEKVAEDALAAADGDPEKAAELYQLVLAITRPTSPSNARAQKGLEKANNLDTVQVP